MASEAVAMSVSEKTLLVTRPTRLIALRFYSVMIIALIVAGIFFLRVIPSFPNTAIGGVSLSIILGVLFLILALIAFLVAELKRKTTRYTITDNKVIREDGIFNKNTVMIPYTQLERVDLRQSFFHRILKVGTLVIDTGDDTMNIDTVRHPAKVQELLSSRLGRRGWTGSPPPQEQK